MTIIGHFVNAIFHPGAQQFDASMAKAVDEFREERSQDMARLIESRGTAAAQLTAAKEEAAQWREYARKLEQACMAAGVPMPKAPDE